MGAVRKRSDGIATSERLMAEAAKEIQRFGIENFDVQRVMDRAKATNGSLYHHFGSKNGLIIAAESHLLLESYDQGNQLLRLLTENAQNIDEFASHLELMVRTATNTESEESRRRRVRALALAQHNPALAEKIRKSQIEASNYLANTIQIAVDKGWLRPDIDVRAFSYFQQAVFFGHKLLDISGEGDLKEPWNEIAIIAFKAFLVQDK